MTYPRDIAPRPHIPILIALRSIRANDVGRLINLHDTAGDRGTYRVQAVTPVSVRLTIDGKPRTTFIAGREDGWFWSEVTWHD